MNDISIIGVGKDAYNDYLPVMVEGRILPWVEDTEDDGYPVKLARHERSNKK